MIRVDTRKKILPAGEQSGKDDVHGDMVSVPGRRVEPQIRSREGPQTMPMIS